VLAVDMRGHGDSAWDEGLLRIQDYVKDIAALIAHLNLRNIVLWDIDRRPRRADDCRAASGS
jgi:pimeloyl-ACP methyl ester carboxylesterase